MLVYRQRCVNSSFRYLPPEQICTVPSPCVMCGRFIRNSKAVRRESTDAILLPFPLLSAEKCSPIEFMRSKNCTRKNRTMIWIGTSYQKN